MQYINAVVFNGEYKLAAGCGFKRHRTAGGLSGDLAHR
jgi:hypothetical protein